MKMYFSILEDWEDLTDEEVGILLRACLAYAKDGSMPSFAERHMMIAFRAQKRHIDEDCAEYQEKVEKCKKSADARWNPNASERIRTHPNASERTQEKEKEKEKENLFKERVREKARFTPPTLQEVEEYVDERGLDMDAGAFFDHFTSNGWKVGGRTPMKDWKASVRNWARNEGRFGTARKKPEQQYSNAELEKLEVDLNGGDFSW